jgi:hypothetical protein
VHISAVEKAGLSTLNEGAKASYEEVPHKGKTSAENFEGEFGRAWRRPPVHAGGRFAAPGVSVVPIARRIEALDPLKALYAEISATGG